MGDAAGSSRNDETSQPGGQSENVAEQQTHAEGPLQRRGGLSVRKRSCQTEKCQDERLTVRTRVKTCTQLCSSVTSSGTQRKRRISLFPDSETFFMTRRTKTCSGNFLSQCNICKIQCVENSFILNQDIDQLMLICVIFLCIFVCFTFSIKKIKIVSVLFPGSHERL